MTTLPTTKKPPATQVDRGPKRTSYKLVFGMLSFRGKSPSVDELTHGRTRLPVTEPHWRILPSNIPHRLEHLARSVEKSFGRIEIEALESVESLGSLFR